MLEIVIKFPLALKSLAVARQTFPALEKLRVTEKMASVPYGMHAAQKVRHNMMLESKPGTKQENFSSSGQSRNWQQFTLPHKQIPQYSEKMMNSIWGLYNRYSVHNFKSNTVGGQKNFQQSA